MTVPRQAAAPAWLLLVFSLPAKRASERVDIWRKLQRYGAIPLRSSGYLLPNSPETKERFEWLAASIRKYKGQASVVQVQAIDELPAEKVQQPFCEARSRDYEKLMRELRRLKNGKKSNRNLASIRRRFSEIVAIDFFDSPLRSRVEALLASAAHNGVRPAAAQKAVKKEYQKRVWITRPRPGIDRVSSAWLIRRYIDPAARFTFADDPEEHPDAIPFDMFQSAGFGHRGEDCTFETLRKEFGIRDLKVAKVAEIIHDADLDDGKFGHEEGRGLDRVLIGWAQQGLSDEELLRRGMELIEGLYYAVP